MVLGSGCGRMVNRLCSLGEERERERVRESEMRKKKSYDR